MIRAVLLLAVFCLGADCEQARIDGLDAGRMVLSDGTEMSPSTLPWRVVADDSIDRAMVVEAVAWWGEESGMHVFVMDDSAQPWDFGVIEVSSGYSTTEDLLGVFNDVTDDDGLIQSGNIIISSDILYDDDYTFHVILHEMGHALGLADDPHSIDLDSIMSSPVIVGSSLTSHDRALL